MATKQNQNNTNPYWRWMLNTDPEATRLAMQWAEEHAEEMKMLDRMLYNNQQRFSRHNYPTEPEKLEYIEQVTSFDPDDYIPQEVLDRLYDDKRWFVRAKYMPDVIDEDDQLYLPAEIVEGLHELTELQREVLFRTVINGEPVSSVAHDKSCSDRNIRDIRIRAIERLRKKTNVDTRGSLPTNTILPIIGLLYLMGIIAHLISPCLHYLERVPMWLVISVVAVALPVIDVYMSRRAAEKMIRCWWDYLNTPKEK